MRARLEDLARIIFLDPAIESFAADTHVCGKVVKASLFGYLFKVIDLTLTLSLLRDFLDVAEDLVVRPTMELKRTCIRLADMISSDVVCIFDNSERWLRECQGHAPTNTDIVCIDHLAHPTTRLLRIGFRLSALSVDVITKVLLHNVSHDVCSSSSIVRYIIHRFSEKVHP